jgi:hypothetical protein
LASYFFATLFVAAILLWLATLWLGKMWPGTKQAPSLVPSDRTTGAEESHLSLAGIDVG